MSSTAPDADAAADADTTGGDAAQPAIAGAAGSWRARLLRVSRRLRDLLALLAVAAIGAGVWLYVEGVRFAGDMAPDTRRYLAQAGWETLRGNLAETLSTRVAVAEGTTPEAVALALSARAQELGVPLEPLYPGDGFLPGEATEPAPGDEAMETTAPADSAPEFSLRSWSACYADDVASLVALEPELLAFMPCRVNLYRDAAGRLWLATTDLELLVSGGREPVDALRREAVRVRDRILDLMAAAGG